MMISIPSMRVSFARCSLALAILFFVVPSFSWAAPPMNECNESDSGERIKCKFGNILVQQQATTDMMGGMSSTTSTRA